MTETSKEYAVALFELAKENGNEKEILDGLTLAREVFDSTPELELFLKSPAISRQTRLDTVQSAFGEDVPEHVTSFICLLAESGNSGLLPSCADEYAKLYEISNRVTHAVVKSAVELTDEEKTLLAARLEAMNGTKFELKYEIDTSLIGGITVEADGMILDGSLRRRLQTIKEVMNE